MTYVLPHRTESMISDWIWILISRNLVDYLTKQPTRALTGTSKDIFAVGFVTDDGFLFLPKAPHRSRPRTPHLYRPPSPEGGWGPRFCQQTVLWGFLCIKKTASFFIKVSNISPHTDWSYQYTYYIAQNSQVCLPIE